MIEKPTEQMEKNRQRTGPHASHPIDGNNGAFIFSHRGVRLLCIVSDGGGWEHVSVSPYDAKRCPTWEEMCYIKNLWWKPEEVVIQYHPAQSDYVNIHPYVLHLWRPVEQEVPTPPLIFV